MSETFKVVLFLLKASRRVNFSRAAIGAALVTGLLSGLGYTCLVALINHALTANRSSQLLYAFVGLCVIVPTNRIISQALFNAIGARAIFDMRLQLSRGILNSPLRNLEEIGPHRLFASLTDDVQAITAALVQIPNLSMHFAIVVAGLCYMAWLSRMLLLLVLGGMVVGVLSYNLPLAKARGYLRHLRDHTDALFGQFRGLVDGAKELRLHRKRREAFFASGLVPTGEEIRRYTFLGNTVFTAASAWGNLLFLIIIGLLVFVGTRWADQRTLSGYTLTLLYMMTPLEIIMLSLPVLGRAATAVDKLERLGLELPSDESERLEQAPEPETSWKQIEFVDVAYSYAGEEGEGGFEVGPLSLTFQRGELVFLIGGNGSGKTTFAKILTGLYSPQSGEIRLDGSRVTDENRDGYRQLFSAVFSDFYLFGSLLGLEEGEKDLDARARVYLKHLELDSKVRVEQGVLSTVNLSQGQRKRLALLTAYLEDRPIYFFDEWAADQDPHYKEIFYFEVLPELKARGKTVFVISHDDQYYGLGDRLIKLNYGKVERDETCSTDGPVPLKAREARVSGAKRRATNLP
jgi:putative ATP-binding cassette transporter